METQGYEFTCNEGKQHIGGKVYHPHMLRFNLSKEEAFELALSILNRYKNVPDLQEYQLCFFGEIKRNIEDDFVDHITEQTRTKE